MPTRESTNDHRTLTSADIEALLDRAEERFISRFYNDLGKGIWGFFRKGFAAIVIALAVYGWYLGHKP